MIRRARMWAYGAVTSQLISRTWTGPDVTVDVSSTGWKRQRVSMVSKVTDFVRGRTATVRCGISFSSKVVKSSMGAEE